MAAQPSSTCSFQHEIKCIMYICGDSRRPLTESVSLVEGITLKQMRELIVQASRVTSMRGSQLVNVEDVLFLIRKNKCKLRRLMRYMNVREMARNVSSQSSLEEEEDSDEEGSRVSSSVGHQMKRRKTLEFLTLADQIGPDSLLLNIGEVDQRERERLELQDAKTKGMDAREYAEYTDCRRAGFRKHTVKFKEWLDINSLTSLRLRSDVIDLLGYLAYETVRDIVELSLLVKKTSDEWQAGIDACTAHTPSITSSAPLETTQPFFTTPVAAASDNGGAAASSPSSPSVAPLLSSGTRESSTATPRHHRKGPASAPLSTSSAASQSFSAADAAIQPRHIREALRRYATSPTCLSPLSTHLSRPTFSQRTLCT